MRNMGMVEVLVIVAVLVLVALLVRWLLARSRG
jgi:hypothetical protein